MKMSMILMTTRNTGEYLSVLEVSPGRDSEVRVQVLWRELRLSYLDPLFLLSKMASRSK